MTRRFDLRLIVLELRYVWNTSLDDVVRKRSTVNLFLVGLVCLALYRIVSVCHCRSSNTLSFSKTQVVSTVVLFSRPVLI